MSVTFYSYNLSEKESFKSVTAGRWALDAFLKLYLSEILPADIKKVLYLDGDVIVRRSLMEIWNTDVSDVPFAGSSDSAEYTKSLQSSMHYDHSKYGFINTGMLVINLDYHRSHGIDKAYDQYILNHYSELLFVDQDVFNNVLYDKMKIIDYVYNVHFASHIIWWNNYPKLSFFEKRKLYNDAYVVHFTGAVKPWHLYSGNIFNEEWDSYLKMSCFSGHVKKARPGYDRKFDVLKYYFRPVYKLLFG